MELKIKNIGRIEEADIELPGITIVASDNGSGKSTISKALYATMETYYAPEKNVEIQKRRSENRIIQAWMNKYIGKYSYNMDNIKQIQKLYSKANGNDDKFASDLAALMNSKISDLMVDSERKNDGISKACSEILCKTYNEYMNKDSEYYLLYLTQMIFDGVFQQQVNCIKETSLAVITYMRNNREGIIKIENNKVVDISEISSVLTGEKVIYITTSDLMDSVGSYKRLYSAEKIGSISYANAQLTKILMEELPMKDMIAEEYHKLEEQRGLFDDIFSKVLEGEIYLEHDKLAYHDNWCDSNIEFQNIASGMKIFLILKRLINNGVFLNESSLIIDEPETNLHPQWQLVLAQLLVLMKNKLDVHIYVNSHSPYFVRAIEYYANQYGELGNSRFYTMRKNNENGMYRSENVTDRLGEIYDKLAEPFNAIM
jgi:predicted ATPase